MTTIASPVGSHRVLTPAGVLPQAAESLDADREIHANEARVRVERLNLDAASYRQLSTAHDGNGAAIRANVLEIIEKRGKMHNPATGSGGMLIGTLEEAGPDWHGPAKPGDRIATLVSLSLTPLEVYDGLADWDGLGEQVPADGHAILFERTVLAVLPDDFDETLALSAFDVCGAPALTKRVVERFRAERGKAPRVAVIGGAGKSGSLSLAAARDAGAEATTAIAYDENEAEQARRAGLADSTAVADATDPMALSRAVERSGGSDVTVVCVDVPGCEHGAVLATNEGGVIVFFSMATSFTGAALGAEGLAADVEMLIGNGYSPGHAEYTLDLLRRDETLREHFAERSGGPSAERSGGPSTQRGGDPDAPQHRDTAAPGPEGNRR
ncbi:L-erythro-3,5-diaminohexanoate dehydrogenase [Salininema proteolyticum]|uniref:L-erythro-3,5-diaminohexanoate dehydrogenase n=1 Tax=Salininema proteolyticum TaxID=1607685 RepID=A0ABV8U2C0_9ACTN